LCASSTKNDGKELTMSGVLAQHNISVELALVAAKAALNAAQSRGYRRSGVAVANRAGQLLVLLRSNDGGPHLIDAARRKAYTAASMNARTSAASKAIDERTGEPGPHLVYLNDILIVGGGVPIHMKGELIGAIGVAGSPGSVHDEECADAGIASIAASFK
jgi:uncharacterized protein GlcG (DUF336 family)